MRTIAAIWCLAVLLVASGCSRFYGLTLRAHVTAPLPAACIKKGLDSFFGLGEVTHRVDDPYYLTPRKAEREGWHTDVFQFPVQEGEGFVYRRYEGSAGTAFRLSWGRVNSPWPQQTCDRMLPYLQKLYAELRAVCDAIPPVQEEALDRCTE